MTITVVHLFQTPIVVDAVPFASRINAALGPVIDDSTQSSTGYRVAGRHLLKEISDDIEADQARRAVIDHAKALATRYSRDVGAPANLRQGWQTRVWATTAGGETVAALRCYDAFWIADYFVDDGYGGGASTDSGGELVVEDPRLPVTMAEEPRLRLRLAPGNMAPRYEPEIRIRPGAGRMLMYPGWLRVTREPSRLSTRARWLTVALIAPVS